MQLLYTAYACENAEGGGKMLLPGYPAKSDMRRLQPGDKIHVELADGTLFHTEVVKTQVSFFTESAQSRFLRGAPDFYCTVIVPGDFTAPGVEIGAKVYADDPPTSIA